MHCRPGRASVQADNDDGDGSDEEEEGHDDGCKDDNDEPDKEDDHCRSAHGDGKDYLALR